VQWQRIIDGGPDLPTLQIGLQIVAALGANRVLIEDRLILRIDRWYTDTVDASQRLGVVARILPPLRAPAGEMRELGAQHSRLERVQTAVVANFVVEVLLGPAVNAKSAQARRKRLILRDDHSAITVTAEILRREEAQGPHRRDLTRHSPRSADLPACANSLRGVFDHRQPFGDRGHLLDRGHLPEQVDRNDRLCLRGYRGGNGTRRDVE